MTAIRRPWTTQPTSSEPSRAEHLSNIKDQGQAGRGIAPGQSAISPVHWLTRQKNASVVRLYDHDARFLALYMENVDAPSLLQYPCGTMTAADRARVLSDTSTALLYIHRQGFVHNDIKPGNILFSRERGAVVIDLGVSSEVGSRGIPHAEEPIARRGALLLVLLTEPCFLDG